MNAGECVGMMWPCRAQGRCSRLGQAETQEMTAGAAGADSRLAWFGSPEAAWSSSCPWDSSSCALPLLQAWPAL